MKVEIPDLLGLAREDLACYAVAQWPGFELAAHHRVIIDKLEAIERGEIRRLMLFLPPRHGKSMLASQFFPAWYLGRHPSRHLIFVTYGQELSDDFGRRVRNLVADPLHRAVFPGFALSEDSTAAHRFNTVAGGAYYAVGKGGPITGRGAHLLIIDDPIKDREEANSETVPRALHEWYTSVAYTRLMPGGAIVLIQTRWHEDDLAGWLLRKQAGENWHVVSLPAIAERDEGFRKEGEALWPETYPLAVLEEKRQAIGGAAWVSLYQQHAAAAEGEIFKREWWQRFTLMPSFRRIVQSWDTAFKSGAENDFSVCTTWGVAENGYFLLSFWKGRPEFPDLKRMMATLAEQWKPNAILVEDKASGQSIIQELERTSALPVLPVKVDSDKVARAHAVTPLVEAGKVFLPESAPWLGDFIDELAAFPTGVHDDAVDSTTQALNYLREGSAGRVLFQLGLVDRTANDREALWERAMRGEPLTEAEIDRM